MNYQLFNIIIIKDQHPLPLISEIQNKIRGMKWFTKFDITDIYYYIYIAEDEEWKTVFRIKYRYYEYLIMLFRLTNIPVSF